jgi:hypothetical protein
MNMLMKLLDSMKYMKFLDKLDDCPILKESFKADSHIACRAHAMPCR